MRKVKIDDNGGLVTADPPTMIPIECPCKTAGRLVEQQCTSLCAWYWETTKGYTEAHNYKNAIAHCRKNIIGEIVE